MNDFELQRRLESARPDLPRRGDPLSPAAESTLQRVRADERSAPRRRRAPIYLSVAASVVVLLAVAIGVLFIARPAPVYADVTPPMLRPTSVEGTSEDLLLDLSRHLKPAKQTTTVEMQSWARSMTVGEDGTIEKVTIEPEVRTFEHGPDGARIEVRRGEPYDSDGRPIHVDGYRVGELSWEMDFGPGEYESMFGEPPESAAEFGAFIREPSGAETYTTGEYLNDVNSVLIEHRLTTPQSKALLEFLAGLPDLEVEGEVVDRLGRSGISFSTDSRNPGEFVDRIIVSDQGLGVISSETVYIGHSMEGVQAPSVWCYFAWE